MAAILHTLLAAFLKLPFARTALYDHPAASVHNAGRVQIVVSVPVGAAWMAWHNDLKPERQVANILRDLRRRKSNWLRSAARDMAKAMEGDWKKYRDS